VERIALWRKMRGRKKPRGGRKRDDGAVSAKHPIRELSSSKLLLQLQERSLQTCSGWAQKGERGQREERWNVIGHTP
jgi:hypothetical protein